MSMEKWPCNPDSFSSILPGDLPYFLQTGATHALGRPVSIIDPQDEKRYDAIKRFDKFRPMCKYIREEIDEGWDEKCTNCDLLVAKQLIAEGCQPENIVKYRCYVGLEECATIIRVGGLSVMVVSGQFKPPEGLDDAHYVISQLSKQALDRTKLSPAMQQSLSRFNIPNEQWLGKPLSEENRIKLRHLIEAHEKVDNQTIKKFRNEVRRIETIAQSYYDLAKAKIEAQIMESLASTLSGILPRDNTELWQVVTNSLETLKRSLDLEYVAFFSSEDETDTVLFLKAWYGSIPGIEPDKSFPHFNWKKARLATTKTSGTDKALREWNNVGISDHTWLIEGFRGGPNPFVSCGGLIPIMLPNGPYGLLVLGPQMAGADLSEQNGFVISACRELSTRILTLQLSQILRVDRQNWRRTAQLTGHRIRASLQSIGSQLKTIEAVHNGEQGFTTKNRTEAERDLKTAFKDLTEISYAGESSVRGALDVKSARRDYVPLGKIIWAAVAIQQEVADLNSIELRVAEEISALPVVWVNETLMRFVFINLINNGLKYSYPRPDNGKRYLTVGTPKDRPDAGETRVEIVNFGLGIKVNDLQRIFEWGIRLVPGHSKFQEVYGKGIGLWEVKHIVEGHGGKIFARSTHYTKAPVTDQNIQQCITVFTVSLPTTISSNR